MPIPADRVIWVICCLAISARTSAATRSVNLSGGTALSVLMSQNCKR